MFKKIFFVLVALFLHKSYKVNAQNNPAKYSEDYFSATQWRNIGPFRGGRSAAVTGVKGKATLFYMGSTGGGVWRTTDAGNTWKNISDGFFGGSVGSIAVSEWDNNVIYVGNGEKTVRGNVSSGDGVWKTVNAGKTWEHVGLKKVSMMFSTKACRRSLSTQTILMSISNTSKVCTGCPFRYLT